MLSCYALSGVPDMLEAAAMEDPLSERERECLTGSRPARPPTRWR